VRNGKRAVTSSTGESNEDRQREFISSQVKGGLLRSPATHVQDLEAEGRAVERVERPDRSGAVVKYNPTKDGVRWFLARGLVWILGGTIFAILALLATKRWTGLTTEEISNSTAAIFTALVSLTGSALGFYFGTKDADNS
jgi:hypothetical protein